MSRSSPRSSPRSLHSLLGLVLLQLGWMDGIQFATPQTLLTGLDTLTSPVVSGLDSFLPAGILFVIGLGMLLGGFACFDRALPESSAAPDPSGVRADRPLAMFALGGAVTLVTLSVAVSVTLLVPLALRGYVRREQVVPYVMGANITTFVDTLVVAVLLGGQAAFTVVVVQILAMTAVAGIILLLSYRQFARTVLALSASATHSRQRFAIFLALISVVPLALLLV
ncbi:MAG: hypothetical protein U5Q44_03200 [Dehalococcoidia bacterium]|nr:hypothetical protein [Dehalococcoidia bacterium]